VFNKIKQLWSRWRQHFWVSLATDVCIILAVMWAIHIWQTRQLPFDQPAPVTQLTSLAGEQLSSAITENQVGVVYFFAPWCTYCRHSIGNLDALLESGSLAWATAVALDYTDLTEVDEFVTETGISLPVLMGDKDTAIDWGVRAFPTYFVIDEQGRIVSRSVGYSTALGLKARILFAGG